MSAGAEVTDKWWWPRLNNQAGLTRVLNFNILAKYYTKKKKKDLWIEKIYGYIKTGCQKGKSSVSDANLPMFNLTACIKRIITCIC